MVLKVFISDYTRETEQAIEFGKSIEENGHRVEYLDADDASNAQQQELYDIYSYPSFVVARDDGSEVECWRGKIPLKDDVVLFLNI